MKNPYLAGWLEEKHSAYLYQVIASKEPQANRQSLFSQLGDEAVKQAGLWEEEARKTGLQMPTYRPSVRVRIVALLIRFFGPCRIKSILAATKIRGLSVYSCKRSPGSHPLPVNVEEVGASHQGVSNSGGLRAAVFGVNDGLVSVACLVLGVAGAATDQQIILLTGVAGLMAGAFSMAAGEYVSMRSQREMFEHQIHLEREELAQYPEEEAHELMLIYMARGMQAEEAKALAARMIADPELGLDTLTREELGLNPEELGSPWVAAISSFLSFMVGGLIPLLPYIFGHGPNALLVTILLTGASLFSVGAVLSLFSGRSPWYGGMRMLLIGAAAGGLTYLIGALVGVSLA
ncbi:MAG: hypothetical protein CVU15_05935 [Betaproteobacteria bacterium HGW-Betaproteobacteria-1]|jgi:VIT1/CCC1 family predicted Fe2+/Mn2+ transporter|nr:MAG: hypothetical protein CVU15_05935 [Betaproteobacteria bacterium HGW-Betaproteobacteria-1]